MTKGVLFIREGNKLEIFAKKLPIKVLSRGKEIAKREPEIIESTQGVHILWKVSI